MGTGRTVTFSRIPITWPAWESAKMKLRTGPTGSLSRTQGGGKICKSRIHKERGHCFLRRGNFLGERDSGSGIKWGRTRGIKKKGTLTRRSSRGVEERRDE